MASSDPAEERNILISQVYAEWEQIVANSPLLADELMKVEQFQGLINFSGERETFNYSATFTSLEELNLDPSVFRLIGLIRGIKVMEDAIEYRRIELAAPVDTKNTELIQIRDEELGKTLRRLIQVADSLCNLSEQDNFCCHIVRHHDPEDELAETFTRARGFISSAIKNYTNFSQEIRVGNVNRKDYVEGMKQEYYSNHEQFQAYKDVYNDDTLHIMSGDHFYRNIDEICWRLDDDEETLTEQELKLYFAFVFRIVHPREESQSHLWEAYDALEEARKIPPGDESKLLQEKVRLLVRLTYADYPPLMNELQDEVYSLDKQIFSIRASDARARNLLQEARVYETLAHYRDLQHAAEREGDEAMLENLRLARLYLYFDGRRGVDTTPHSAWNAFRFAAECEESGNKSVAECYYQFGNCMLHLADAYLNGGEDTPGVLTMKRAKKLAFSALFIKLDEHKLEKDPDLKAVSLQQADYEMLASESLCKGDGAAAEKYEQASRVTSADTIGKPSIYSLTWEIKDLKRKSNPEDSSPVISVLEKAIQYLQTARALYLAGNSKQAKLFESAASEIAEEDYEKPEYEKPAVSLLSLMTKSMYSVKADVHAAAAEYSLLLAERILSEDEHQILAAKKARDYLVKAGMHMFVFETVHQGKGVFRELYECLIAAAKSFAAGNDEEGDRFSAAAKAVLEAGGFGVSEYLLQMM